MHEAAQACRRKGRVVIVGDVGLELRRSDLYEKELDVVMSTSYGPGRYDPVYELEGRDYPLGYVRWTENRNMEEYLRLLATGALDLSSLPQERFEIDERRDRVRRARRRTERRCSCCCRIRSGRTPYARRVETRTVAARSGRIGVALVGAGAFAQGSHVPNLQKLDDRFQIRAVASRTGATREGGRRRESQAAYATTDLSEVLADPEIDLVLIATRHDLHAAQTLEALEAGKHVFVEKPLALDEDELARIEAFYADRDDAPLLMTGFNRRFSPAIARARELLAARTTPLIADYRMNAGYLPLDHWVHGPEGGGRNIGEACHIYDLFDSLVGGAEVEAVTRAVDPPGRNAAAPRTTTSSRRSATPTAPSARSPTPRSATASIRRNGWRSSPTTRWSRSTTTSRSPSPAAAAAGAPARSTRVISRSSRRWRRRSATAARGRSRSRSSSRAMRIAFAVEDRIRGHA